MTLSRSLMPARLPVVAGLESAAFYEPLSADHVGGDFYDLFPADDEGTWGCSSATCAAKG